MTITRGIIITAPNNLDFSVLLTHDVEGCCLGRLHAMCHWLRPISFSREHSHPQGFKILDIWVCTTLRTYEAEICSFWNSHTCHYSYLYGAPRHLHGNPWGSCQPEKAEASFLVDGPSRCHPLDRGLQLSSFESLYGPAMPVDRAAHGH